MGATSGQTGRRRPSLSRPGGACSPHPMARSTKPAAVPVQVCDVFTFARHRLPPINRAVAPATLLLPTLLGPGLQCPLRAAAVQCAGAARYCSGWHLLVHGHYTTHYLSWLQTVHAILPGWPNPPSTSCLYLLIHFLPMYVPRSVIWSLFSRIT